MTPTDRAAILAQHNHMAGVLAYIIVFGVMALLLCWGILRLAWVRQQRRWEAANAAAIERHEAQQRAARRCEASARLVTMRSMQPEFWPVRYNDDTMRRLAARAREN